MVATTERLSKSYETKLKAEEGAREVIARISTASVDRDGDVLLPSGVILKDFYRNPIMLLSHDSRTLPIGRWTSVEKEAGGLVGRGVFAERPKYHPPDAEWVPDTVLSLFQQGVLRAFSVGFTIEDAREPTNRDKSQFGSDVRRVIARWKLLEVSAVALPANQDALTVAVSKSYLGGIFPRREISLDITPSTCLDIDEVQERSLHLD